MIQAHVFYSGTVQGVGFRYAVRQYAADAGLSGWVRNLPDGRVEVLAEGEKDALAGFLRKIETHFEGYISGKIAGTGAAQGTYKGFMIIS